MSDVGDYVYSLATAPADRLGVIWITITRRVVQAIDGDSVTLSRAVYASYPTHTPPASLEDADWQIGDPVGRLVTSAQIGAGKTWDPAPDLGEEQAIDTAAAFALRASHRNHIYVNREKGKPAPVLDQTDELTLAILDWRDPR